MFLDILTKCKGAEGASEDDALGIMTHSIPSTRSGGCLNACVMEITGIVSRNLVEYIFQRLFSILFQIKDGKFSVEGAVQVAGMSGDPNKPKNVGTIGLDCVSVVGADRLVICS